MTKNDIDLKETAYYLNLIYTLASVVIFFGLIGAFLGFLLDKLFIHKIGIFFTAFLLVGIGFGVWRGYKLVCKKEEQKNKDKNSEV